MKFCCLILVSLLGQSCSELLTHRTFVDKMDDEGPMFFSPERDFPVISGDSGRSRPSSEDVRRRTPTSDSEDLSFDEKNALEQELKFLEDSQTTEKYYHYLEYRDKLANLSEKIYFLRISSIKERNNFLYGKGLYQHRNNDFAEIESAVTTRDIIVGMNKSEVTRSWGRPTRVDVAGNPIHENERWTFYDQGRLKQVYFESGKVQGWDIKD